MGFFNKSKKDNDKAPADQARFHYQQADKASQKGRYKQAREEVQKAIDLEPGLSEARKLFEAICYGLALEKNGVIDEVISLLKECIEVNPATESHAKLGRIYQFQKKSKEANGEYREHLAIHPYWEYMPGRIDGKPVRGLRSGISDELVRRMLGLEPQWGLPFRFTTWNDIRKSLGIPIPDMETLIEALKDGDEDVRFAAVAVLEEIGDRKTVEQLTKVLEDEDENVRRDAEYAIKRIKAKLSDSE